MAAPDHLLTRRQALALAAAASAAVVIAACGGDEESSSPVAADTGTEPLSPTPSCGDEGSTPEQTEGPFFTPDSPQRGSLIESGITGAALILSGRVLDTDCRPLAGALLDFWQADGRGAYDNEGFRLRGHQFSDSAGRYRLETVIPGRYPGRTPHIHVKAQPAGGAILTTQLYFPGEPGNESDPIFDPLLLVDLREEGGGGRALFDFVLEPA